jgi:hypothetical protein
MNTKDFYAELVSESTHDDFFIALRQLTRLDDPRSAFSGPTAAVPWTAWYVGNTGDDVFG